MKCVNCGYELAKPNIKNCPLCGHRVNPGEVLPEDGLASSGKKTVEPASTDEALAESPAPWDVEPPHDAERESVEANPVSTADTSRQEKVAFHENPPACDDAPASTNAGAAEESLKHSDSRQVSHHPQEEIIPEDPDQYLENGSYQPYPDDAEDDADYADEQTNPSGGQSATWLIYMVAAIAGLLLGVALYLIIE